MLKFKNIRRQIVMSGIIFALLALLFGVWSQHNIGKKDQNTLINIQNGTVFPNPKEISDFQLTGADQKSFDNENLKHHWSMLFFGFTNCPMLCPTTLTTLNQTYQKLNDSQFKDLPQVVFISIDPERDSVQRINEYVHSFNANFYGATGSKEQLEKLTKNLNILYLKIAQNKNDQNYQIDHSGTVLLVNPKGELQAIFSPPIDAIKLAEDYQTILAAQQG